MGSVNWTAVGLAALLALAFVPLSGRSDRGRAVTALLGLGIALIAAAMLGHALARIGADTLALKPWLYFMQSGGLAIAFVIPAVALVLYRAATPSREIAIVCARFLGAYLAMGAAFWLLG